MADIPTVVTDTGADLKRLRKLERLGLIKLRRIDLEQPSKKYRTLVPPTWRINDPQAGRIGHFAPGDEDSAARFAQMMEVIGAANHTDVSHLEAAVRIGADYFVTNNPGDFICGGKREALQRIWPGTKIVTIGELEAALQG